MSDNTDGENSVGEFTRAQRSGSNRENTENEDAKNGPSIDSPDLSPCDFSFVGRAMIGLQNRRVVDLDNAVNGRTNLFDSVSFMSFSASSRAGFGDWSG
jgi:hypothetical protein